MHLQLASITTNTPEDDLRVEHLNTSSCSHKCYQPQSLSARPGDSAEEPQKLLHSRCGPITCLATKVYIVVIVLETSCLN